MIDFHCHILPGIDDGSQSVQESKALMRLQKEQGVDLIVATPHFYADENTPRRFVENRNKAYKAIEDFAKEQDLQIALGAEVHYFTNIASIDLSPFLIGDTDLLLLEMPFGKWTPSMILEVLRLQEKVQVVLAHIERYWHWQPLRQRVWSQLADAGVMFQVNCSGLLSPDNSRKILKMIKKDQIAFLGSDTHNLDVRPPRFSEAFAVMNKKLGEDAKRQLVHSSEQIYAAHRCQES